MSVIPKGTSRGEEEDEDLEARIEKISSKDADNEERDADGMINKGSSSLRQETILMGKTAAPYSGASLLNLCTNFVILFFVGRYLSAVELAAVGMANSVANVTGMSIMVAFTLGYSTLGAQAYGARNYNRLGLLLHRVIICQMSLLLVIPFLWWNLGTIFRKLGQSEDIVVPALFYLKLRFAQLPVDGLFSAMRSWMVCLYKFTMVSAASATAPIWALGFAMLFFQVQPFGLGIQCAALTGLCAQLVCLIFVVAGIVIQGNHKLTWVRPQAGSFNPKGLWELIRFSIPGSIIMWAEWWFGEICTLLAARISTASVATETVLGLLATMIFMTSLGFARSSQSRIGNLLGEGRWVDARTCFRIGLAMVTISAMVMAVVIFTMRHIWVRTFLRESDPDAEMVIQITERVAPLASLFVITDGLQIYLSCALRGMALQVVPAVVYLAALYGIGLPLGLYVCFTQEQGLWGLWLGKIVGMAVVVVSLLIYTAIWVDFRKCSVEARKRALEKDSEKQGGESEVELGLTNAAGGEGEKEDWEEQA